MGLPGLNQGATTPYDMICFHCPCNCLIVHNNVSLLQYLCVSRNRIYRRFLASSTCYFFRPRLFVIGVRMQPEGWEPRMYITCQLSVTSTAYDVSLSSCSNGRYCQSHLNHRKMSSYQFNMYSTSLLFVSINNLKNASPPSVYCQGHTCPPSLIAHAAN
jgi:hypothetical protein